MHESLVLKKWVQNFVFGWYSKEEPVLKSLKGQIAKSIIDSNYDIWIIYKCRKLRRLQEKNMMSFTKGLIKAKKEGLL